MGLIKHFSDETIDDDGSMLKPTTRGVWFLASEEDPRFRASGESESVGGFVEPPECRAKIIELTKRYGKPPKDLEFGYMKN